ncbi:ABC transporter permease [Kribbella deserti]|uniref:ABC transporter permease n=1 Tax=Kribbella deserti TaxID=1926257 RepID=A0ABV6QT23_9ACTN
MRRSVLNSLRAHLGRLVAACLAIVLGVGFATLALTVRSSASHGVDETIGAQYKGVDAVVRSQGEPLLDKELAAIRALPQTEVAIGATTAYLETTWKGDVRPSYFPVAALANEPRLPGPKVKDGRLPRSASEIAIPAGTADKRELPIGSKLTLVSTNETKNQLYPVTVVGIIDDTNSFGEASAVAIRSAVLKWSPGTSYDRLLIAAKSGVTPEALTSAISAKLSAGQQVFTGAEFIELEIKSVTNGIDVLGGVFGMFALISLFVACLVIANTFTILIAQRTREMALLRCVGASRRQVFRSVLSEAGIVGAVASAIGVAFGLLLAAVGLALAVRFDWGIPKIDLYADPISLVVPFLLGLIATVCAAIVPARRATRVAPLAALRPDTSPVAATKKGKVRLTFGFLLIALGGLLLYRGATAVQVLVGVAGGVLSFAGVLMIGSLLVPALIKVVGVLPLRTGGVPGRIAVGNAVRNPRRTAATTSALLIGVTLISLTCVGIGSVEKTFDYAMDDEFPVDLIVSTSEKLPANAQAQLQQIQGIDKTVAVRQVLLNSGSFELYTTGIDPAGAKSVARGIEIGQLKPGVALLDRQTMRMLGLNDGAALTLKKGGKSLKVEAQQADGFDPVVLSSSDLQKLAPAAPVTGFWLDANDRVDGSQVVRDVEQSIPSVRNLGVMGGLAERSFYTKVFDVLLAVGVSLLGVSVLIALVGVGNTLSLSVLERTRENALLRALGLTRRQLRGMLAIESLLMALVAAGLGVGLGLVYGWAGTAALMGNQTKAVQYAAPVGLLVTIALVAAAAGLLASVLPARRAAKVAPAGALATE